MTTALVSLGGIASAGVAAPRLLDRECGPLPPGITVRVECHWLVVPENRDDPTSQEINIAVAVMHSYADEPEPDPVVFLAGGPGDQAIAGLENFVTSPMLDTRDIVLLDQRGTGLSEPSLDCPERVNAAIVNLSDAQDTPIEFRRLREATIECRKRLLSEGIDLGAYNTEQNAADVADLRLALELDEWNLYGVSYGTRLALETMRSHPEGIRTAVLDSVYPPDVGGLQIYTDGAAAAFERLVDACNADPSCSVEQPDLDQILEDVVAKYNETPAEITTSAGVRLLLTGDDIYAGLFDAMRITDTLPALPTIIESIADGDLGLLEVQAEAGLTAFGTPMKGMFMSVECADTAKFSNAKRDAQEVAHTRSPASALVQYTAQAFCTDWKVKPLPDAFSRPVRSRIPTLVLAGSLDPITPASDSERTAERLRNATYIEFENFGHGVTVGTDCPRQVRQVFLDDPDAELDLACLDEPAPQFLSQGLI